MNNNNKINIVAISYFWFLFIWLTHPLWDFSFDLSEPSGFCSYCPKVAGLISTVKFIKKRKSGLSPLFLQEVHNQYLDCYTKKVIFPLLLHLDASLTYGKTLDWQRDHLYKIHPRLNEIYYHFPSSQLHFLTIYCIRLNV